MFTIARPWRKGFWIAWRSSARKRRSAFGQTKRKDACRNIARAAPRQSGRRGGEESRKTVPVIVVKYHEAAEDELLTEVGYLELRASGLGGRFLAEVGRAEDLIAQFPESAPEILPGIRKRVLRKFPIRSSIR